MRLGQPHAPVGEHVAEIVECGGVVGVEIEGLAEELLGRLVVLLPFVQRALEEEQIDAVVGLDGEGRGLGVGVFGIFPAAHLGVELSQLHPHLAVAVGVVEERLGHVEGFLVFALLDECSGEHQLEIEIFGIAGNGFASQIRGLVEQFGLAVGFNLLFEAAQGVVSAHVDHLLVGGDGLGGLVLFAVDGGEVVEEEAAVAFLFGGVGAVGVGGEIDHLLVGGGGFIEAAQHVEQLAPL